MGLYRDFHLFRRGLADLKENYVILSKRYAEKLHHTPYCCHTLQNGLIQNGKKSKRETSEALMRTRISTSPLGRPFEEMTQKKKQEHTETMRNQLVNRKTDAETIWTYVRLATPTRISMPDISLNILDGAF